MKNAKRASGIAALLGTLALLGCGGPGEEPREPVEMPTFQNDELSAGRGVWLGTCRACHLLGVAGAPAVTDYGEWEGRIAKGKEALYRSAIDGIRGEDGKYRMPPRGGNPRLSEDQIRLAVDYKIAAVEALARKKD
jgi:cytochrome c5